MNRSTTRSRNGKYVGNSLNLPQSDNNTNPMHHSSNSGGKMIKIAVCVAGIYIGWFIFAIQSFYRFETKQHQQRIRKNFPKVTNNDRLKNLGGVRPSNDVKQNILNEFSKPLPGKDAGNTMHDTRSAPKNELKQKDNYEIDEGNKKSNIEVKHEEPEKTTTIIGDNATVNHPSAENNDDDDNDDGNKADGEPKDSTINKNDNSADDDDNDHGNKTDGEPKDSTINKNDNSADDDNEIEIVPILPETAKTTNATSGIGRHKEDKADDGSDVEEQTNKGLESQPIVKDYSTIRPRVQLSGFTFDKDSVQKAAGTLPSSDDGKLPRIKTITAYLEQPLNDTVPGTGDQGLHDSDGKAPGTPPEFIIPLPLRTHSPDSLLKFEYPKFHSCHDLPAKLPIDAGLVLNDKNDRVYPNVNNKRAEYDVYEDAKFCPVDADPFLPWIHDMFPSPNGDMIHFVAQNKRRCNTGKLFVNILKRLEPQVTIMQGISVKRLDDGEKEALSTAPDLWDPSKTSNSSSNEYIEDMPRYRLAPMEDADEDGNLTRFLCRYHSIEYDVDSDSVVDVIVGETLSVFPINYEFANLRKIQETMLSPRGLDNPSFWLSNFRFDCPIPDNGNLREVIASGESVLGDGRPSIYVDIVPIRTSPRFGPEDHFFSEDMIQRKDWPSKGFDAAKRWGDKNVLPRVEASGRWQNLPICKPPTHPKTSEESIESEADVSENKVEVKPSRKKPHTLVGCLWASSVFTTRGNQRRVWDTTERIREWIEYHLLVGFDHFYVYDNTGAHNDTQSLEETLSIFKDSEVTRIDWPSIVCNNNIPAHENTGERSSQYAAESSCRQRYGQYTEWMAAFDADEYFVPMGSDDLRDIVNEAYKGGTNVLSFKSTRAYPDVQFTETYTDGNPKGCGTEEEPHCRVKKSDALFLETYNCEFEPRPKPSWATRAKKQIYRPDYVKSHFVHYSTITNGILETYKEATEKGKTWRKRYKEYSPTERFADEEKEIVMLHSKTTPIMDTMRYDTVCKFGFERTWRDKCRVGFPFPENKYVNASNADGFEYNCWKNDKLTYDLIPKLKDAIKTRSIASKGSGQ